MIAFQKKVDDAMTLDLNSSSSLVSHGSTATRTCCLACCLIDKKGYGCIVSSSLLIMIVDHNCFAARFKKFTPSMPRI